MEGWFFTTLSLTFHSCSVFLFFVNSIFKFDNQLTKTCLPKPLPIGASGMGIDVTKITLLSWKPLGLAGKV